MRLDLDRDEIESLIEAVDCLKTKIAFTKGLTSAEKTERLIQAEALETKLQKAHSADKQSPLS